MKEAWPVRSVFRAAFAGDRLFELLHGLLQRPRVARLGPDFSGSHLQPTQLDRIGFVAHITRGDLDDGAFFGVERRQHFALERLEKPGLKINVDFHDMAISEIYRLATETGSLKQGH